MKEKKNIDRLFQEQLKDFEVMPNDQIWLNIESELHKDKKKRRVIPIWFKYAGIASAFILGIFILNNSRFLDSTSTKDIVLNNTSSKILIENKQKPLNNITKPAKEVGIANYYKEDSTKDKKSKTNTISKSTAKNEKEISSSNASKYVAHKKKNHNDTNLFLSKNNSTVNTSVTNQKATDYPSIYGDKSNLTSPNLAETSSTKEQEKVAENVANKQQPTIASETPNELDEFLKKKEEQKLAVVSNSKNKWQITPKIAPIYLNTNSGGSAIDSQFSNNNKTAENTMSYGVGVNYAVSKKLSIRTGINSVNLDYNTTNISYAASLSNNNLSNISYYNTNSELNIMSNEKQSFLSSTEKELQNTNDGVLNQKMGYYELPFEVSYALLDKKIGVNLIGGISTLFLNENKISLVSSQANFAIGEAKNLNNFHLSTNFGVGFNYEFIKSFQLNFEPIVKYQFNTFTRDANDFKPLFLGLYTGLSYSF